MTEATQADVDAAIEKLNNDIQQKRGLPPIQAVPDAIAKPLATEADVDAALEKLNGDVEAKKGAVAQTAKEPEQPARPNPLEYIAKSALTAGANLGAGIMSGQPEAIEGSIPWFNGPAITPATPETVNKEVFGGNGQVIPPDQYSKYAGAAVGSLATNPLGLVSPIGTFGAAVGAGLGSQGGADLADAYLPPSLRPYAALLGGVVGGGLGAGASNALGSAARAIRPPQPTVTGLTPYKPEVTTAYYHDPFSFDNVPIRNADGSSTYPENHPSLNPDGTLKARPPKAIPTDLLYDAQMTPAMLDNAHPQTMAIEKALRSDPRTAKAFGKIDTTNDLAMKRALNDVEVGNVKPDITKLLDQNGRLDADKVASYIDKLKSDGKFDDLPTDHQDVLRLNHVSDLLNRQSRLQSVTPADLSRQGVDPLTHFLAGEPSLQNYLLGHGLNMLAAGGPEPISQGILGGLQLSRNVLRPSAVRRATTRNDNAVNALGSRYTQ